MLDKEMSEFPELKIDFEKFKIDKARKIKNNKNGMLVDIDCYLVAFGEIIT